MLRLSHFLAREIASVSPKNALMSVGQVNWVRPKFARLIESQLFLSVAKEVDQNHGPLSFISIFPAPKVRVGDYTGRPHKLIYPS